MTCPCKDCHARHDKCHSTCDEYKDWSAWTEKQRARRNSYTSEQADADEFLRGQVKRRLVDFSRRRKNEEP